TGASAVVTTPASTDSTAPTAPVVTATAGDHFLNVSWAPATDNHVVAYYRVYPCLVPGCTVPGTAHSFTVRGLTTRTEYDLQLVAVDGDGNSSNFWQGLYPVDTAAAGTTAPSQPQHLISTAGSFGHVTLAWAPSTDDRGVATYDVYRNNRLVAQVSSNSYTDTDVLGATEYFVQAVDTDGSLSAPSARVWFPAPLRASSDTSPPSASIGLPADGATVSGTVEVDSTASDDVGVRKVELYVDGALAGTDTAAPYSFSVDTTTLGDGPHWLFVRAYDAAGNYGTDGVTSVTVANGTSDPTPPTVSIEAPSDGATVSGPVTISADASDGSGVGEVRIDVDGSLLCADSSAPYTCPWDATAAGDHTIEATALDDAGNQASAAVDVTVMPPPDTTPPAVSFGAPAAGATVSGTASVQVSASDDTGVASVSLSLDGATLGTDTSAPWTFGVDTTKLPNGAHSLTATASDAAGNQTSAQESVTVLNSTDTKAPSTPSGVKLAVAGTTQAAIYWSPSTDNVGVAGYSVYRDGVLVGHTTTPSYLDSGLAPGSTHAYTVRAFDAAGNTSAAASKLNAKTVALSKSTSATVAGVVYGSTGKPVSNAVVTLIGNGLTKTAKTNGSGVYQFSSLPAGTYAVAVSSSVLSVVAIPSQTMLVAGP
ncbi:MAG TPA: Ig-like domain-containing protein, partial [Micromonosporaceae bacterium]|nr:Ig-like domain-containing protein [Micromonosporaceae bacterium]